MRLARWIAASDELTTEPGIAEGFVLAEGVIPFPEGLRVSDVLRSGLGTAADLHEQCRALVSSGQVTPTPLAEVRLLSPVVPSTVRDFVAFEEHVEGVSAGVEGKSHVADEWYEAPTFYFTNPLTVRGTGETIDVPVTHRLDYELELAAVIGGAPGKNLDVAAAEASIFGYTVMNDWSARDLQAREMKVRLGPCKGKDFALTLGPWIVTADELDSRLDDGFLAARAEVRVNGRLLGADLVSNMGWTFPELVAYASRNSVVVAGDVLGSGTVGNGGCLGELWGLGHDEPPLEPGDEVRMSIEGIGEIVNVVGRRVPAPALPRARSRSRERNRHDRDVTKVKE